MNRPVTLTIAVVLQWIAAAFAIFVGLELVTASIELSDKDTKSALGQTIAASGVTDVSASLVVRGLFIAGAVVLALAILRIVLALYLARGRNWARMVITILVVLNLLTGVAYLFQEMFWQGIGMIVLELVVLWLLFNPSASAFIADRSKQSVDA
jgi:ABC-type spermidine/putrescine transport system permease subunit I